MFKTVKDLREALADLDDNCPVLVKPQLELEFAEWGYNTREVKNAYRAQDDRYGSPVLIIALGSKSP